MSKVLKSMDLGSVLFGASVVVLAIAIFFASAGVTKKIMNVDSELDDLHMEIDLLNTRVDYLEERRTNSNHQVLEKIMHIMIQQMQKKNDQALDK